MLQNLFVEVSLANKTGQHEISHIGAFSSLLVKVGTHCMKNPYRNTCDPKHSGKTPGYTCLQLHDTGAAMHSGQRRDSRTVKLI
jgi:hypothetical protein